MLFTNEIFGVKKSSKNAHLIRIIFILYKQKHYDWMSKKLHIPNGSNVSFDSFWYYYDSGPLKITKSLENKTLRAL